MTKKAKKESEEAVLEEALKEAFQAEETSAENAETDADNSSDSIETLQKTIDDLNDKYLRLNAEFQNYRKRVEKEKNDIFKFGNEKLLIDMLPIMDTFDRAMTTFEDAHPDDKVLNGIKLIKKSFDDFFEKNGIHKINAVGEAFDPDKHHAVMSEESDEHESDVVVEVFQEGYALNDKIIRPSMVKVSK